MGARNDADLRQRIWSSIAQPGEATNATMSKKRDCRTFLFGNTALALSWQQSVFKRSAAFRIQALNSERWKRFPHPRIRISEPSNTGLQSPRGSIILSDSFGKTPFTGRSHCSDGFSAAGLIKHFMAVKIRMKRVGAKNAPVFRIVVAGWRKPPGGQVLEGIRTY